MKYLVLGALLMGGFGLRAETVRFETLEMRGYWEAPQMCLIQIADARKARAGSAHARERGTDLIHHSPHIGAGSLRDLHKKVKRTYPGRHLSPLMRDLRVA